MKNVTIKRTGIAVAISIGMLFSNVSTALALTNDTGEIITDTTKTSANFDTDSSNPNGFKNPITNPSAPNGSVDPVTDPSSPDGSKDPVIDPSSPDGSKDPVADPSSPDGSEDPVADPSSPDGSENPVADPSSPDGSEDPVADPSSPDGSEDPVVDPSSPDGSEDPVVDPSSPDGSEDPVADPSSPDDAITIPSDNENTNDSNLVNEETEDTNVVSNETPQAPPVSAVGSYPSYTENTNPTGMYIQPSYNPSEKFIRIEDRIKYNTALPIDNIPSFITQEMIIGALKCQDETGYPASVTIAQIILESGFGNYGPGGDDHQGLSYLAYEYCNLFGIKGFGTAGSVDLRTGEQAASGEYYTITAGFRVYNTYTECIKDRTELLKEVYSDLTEGVTDANTFAARIGSRWATSLEYSKNLITLMKEYDLYRLDRMTLKDFSDMIGKFADPCPGSYLTSSFGYRTFDNSFHKGIDLGTNGSSIPTYAAEAGTVIIADYSTSAGNWVVIDHGNGLTTKYMHHSHIFVKAGDKVEKGQQIGLTGNTGNSFGVHLHFQVEENGVAVDPTTYLNSYTE